MSTSVTKDYINNVRVRTAVEWLVHEGNLFICPPQVGSNFVVNISIHHTNYPYVEELEQLGYISPNGKGAWTWTEAGVRRAIMGEL